MSGDMRVGMLIQANARQAIGEVQALREAQGQLAQGVSAAGRAASGATPAIAGVGAASRASAQQIIAAVGASGELATVQQIVRAAINPLVGEYNELHRAMADITMAEDLGAISAREAALAMDGLTRKANEIVAAMEAAGTAIDGTAVAAARQDTAVQQLINRQVGLGGATEEAIADQLRHGQVLDQLRAQYDPLFAASRRYELELHEIAEAERLGAISATTAAAARQRASAALAPMPGQLQRVGASTQTAAAYAGQLTYQLNDIGMMMAMGQSPFMLMVQQGPQVVQVFSAMRASSMAIGPALASSFGMMLNPMALGTMAAIGLGAALVQHLSAGESKAESLVDTLSDLKGAVQDVDTAMTEARRGIVDLRQEFGGGARAARELNLALLELNRLKAELKVTEAIDAVGRSINDLSSFGVTNIRTLEREFNLTEDGARNVVAAMQEFGRATTLEEKVAASNAIAESFSRAEYNIGGASEGAIALSINTAEAAIEALRLKGYTQEADRIAAQFASNNMADPIIHANSAAALLVGNLASAVDMQNALNRAAAIGDPGGRGDGMAEWRRRQADQQGSGQVMLADPSSDVGNRISSIINPRAGAGNSGGASAAQKEADALKELIAAQKEQIAMLRETDPVQAEILKNHEALKAATAAEKKEVADLIAERQRLEQIRDAVAEIGQIGEDAFKGLLTGAYSFTDALSMVLSKLAEMAASSAWDMIWGSANGGLNLGGLLGDLFSGAGKKADGGKIAGPGGPRDDAVLTWMSNGEYAVNAAATAANEPLLEAINAGAGPAQLLAVLIGNHAPKYADGGRIGASAPSSWREAANAANRTTAAGAAEAGALRVVFVPTVDKSGNLGAFVRSVSRDEAGSVMADGLQAYSLEVLPDRISEINRQPRMRG